MSEISQRPIRKVRLMKPDGEYKSDSGTAGSRRGLSIAPKINVDDHVVISQGRLRGEKGVVKSSGHGFYCVVVRGRGEIMKRATELELDENGTQSLDRPVSSMYNNNENNEAARLLLFLRHDHSDHSWANVQSYDRYLAQSSSSNNSSDMDTSNDSIPPITPETLTPEVRPVSPVQHHVIASSFVPAWFPNPAHQSVTLSPRARTATPLSARIFGPGSFGRSDVVMMT